MIFTELSEWYNCPVALLGDGVFVCNVNIVWFKIKKFLPLEYNSV